MFDDISRRELDLELLRDRLHMTDAATREWCLVFGEYLARLASKN